MHEAISKEKKALEKTRNDAHLLLNNVSKCKLNCYEALMNAKPDWLICSHVALDKCNVSRLFEVC